MSLLNITNTHLLDAYLEFEDKCLEIERYLDFLDKLDNGSDNHLLSKNSHNIWEVSEISREVQKTIRASTYLLIYNLLESSMCNALDSIHSTLETENIDIQSVSTKLKRIIYNNLKKGLGEKSIDELIKSNIDLRPIIMKHGYNKKDLLSGNFDVDVLKKIEKKYGFQSYPLNGRQGLFSPQTIHEIKVKRNELAHGALSFEQCGQSIPISSMTQKYNEAKNMMLAVFNGLNNFLDQKAYM
ncbi:MAE_28990/MAE_18760 family HEPN-like nuclease [Acinetobacter sp. ANC 7454]|uniref:MAE_28990/MAE_18760 family HEPN-like nuclease n=1 Tax=Acinetobacter thermotolerans TaxID=3151487 RepID=UPI00325AD25F